jgi:hypothetical protein
MLSRTRRSIAARSEKMPVNPAGSRRKKFLPALHARRELCEDDGAHLAAGCRGSQTGRKFKGKCHDPQHLLHTTVMP